jgi:hypothetical protein
MEGHWPKGALLYMTKIKDFMSFTSQTKSFENMESLTLYNVGNGLYRVLTTAKRAFSFQQKRAFIQETLFSFFKWGTLAQKKGHFFTFKKSEGTRAPSPPPWFRGPCIHSLGQH